jgi:hypothetical protein
MARPLQAGEADRIILYSNLLLDWAAVPYTLKLHVTKRGSEVTNTYDMEAVGGQPNQAKIITTTTMFPTEGPYRLQVVAYDGSAIALRSGVATIPVLGN